MKWLKNNKTLLLKYLLILTINIITYILISFYFKNMEYNFLIMFFVVLIADFIILNIKQKLKSIIWIDFILCILIGLILCIFIKDDLIYSTVLFSLFLSNNLAFVQTRRHDKFFKNALEYIIIMFIIIAAMFINIGLKLYLF